jgi:hypothetical protein
VPNRPDWLTKALHEMAGELHTRLTAFDPAVVDEQPVPNMDSPLLVARELRDRELISGSHIEQFVYGVPRSLRLHELEWLDDEPDPFARNDIDSLMYEFLGLRRRTCSLFWGMGEHEWHGSAYHRFQGEVTLEQIVVALHEHDIEALWKAKKLADALGAPQPHFG